MPDRAPIPRLAVCLAVTLCIAPAAPGQTPDSSTNGVRDQIEDLGAEIKKLGDWDDQYQSIQNAIDRMWEERGWNDESDEFARRTAEQVAAIPPWEVRKRIDTLGTAIRDRYQLNDQQYGRLQTQFYREMGIFMFRNAGTILRQTQEAVEARMSGQAFTPEQVARWTRESDNLLQEARRHFERIIEQQKRSFNPRQRAILERDMESYRRRMAAVNELRQQWKQGEWRPEDWGMENDPIQQGLAQAGAPDSTSQPAKAEKPQPQQPTLYSAQDETTWERYVRLFIARFQLDDAQANAAWSILREVQGRADDYRRLHRDELAAVSATDAATSPAYEPIRQLFAELQTRLDRIPTTAQRQRATAHPPLPHQSPAQ